MEKRADEIDHWGYTDLTSLSTPLPRHPAAGPLSSLNIRSKQTTMGALIGTALRKALNSDCAILNSGAIRGNRRYTLNKGYELSERVPVLTFADLAGELPYETEIVSVLMPGAVLEAAIAWSRNGVNDAEPSGAFLQCDNGLCCKQRGKDRWVIESVRGEVFNPSRAYLVALPYHTLHGLDNIQPLVDWAAQQDHVLPRLDAARPAKGLVLDVYYRELWTSLGHFKGV